MTRIWQNQNDVGDRRNRDYGYSLDTKQGFDDYGREPQACIIGDYAGRFLRPGHKSYWIKNNPESDRLLQKVVENKFPAARKTRLAYEAREQAAQQAKATATKLSL